MRLSGIIPPLLTTFTEDGSLDVDRLVRLVDFMKPHVQGFFVCGTYGAGALMSVDERKKVLEVVAGRVGSSYQIVVHVGAVNQRDSISLSEHAAQHGAQALSAVPPYYYHHDDEVLFQYFRDLVHATPLPVYLYDNPGASGNPVSTELINRLADIGLNGVKDSTFDISKTYAVMRKVTKEGFDVVIGSESLLLPAFVMGAQACIAGLANVLPELVGRLHDAARASEMSAARDLQMKVLKMWDILHYGPSIPTALAMLRIRGVDAGYPRKPMLPLSGATFGRVEKAMRETEELWKL